jgi:hypothetical protein
MCPCDMLHHFCLTPILTLAALGSNTYLIKDSLMGSIRGNSDSICRAQHTAGWAHLNPYKAAFDTPDIKPYVIASSSLAAA